MIVDAIGNWSLYFKKESALYEGINFINNFNESMAPGRYEIKGQEIYAIVQSYDTENAANKKIESHKKYVDLQYIVSGKEMIGWSPVAALSESTPYSEERDIIFFRAPAAITPIVMVPGTFSIFFPHDAHQPGCIFEKVEPVRKIVVKVHCSLTGYALLI